MYACTHAFFFFLLPKNCFSDVFLTLGLCSHKLIGAAFSSYAGLLRSVGLREGAALWASKAGGAGEGLLEELFQNEGSGSDLTPGEEEKKSSLDVAESL